eukprot:TRINITY_DN110119_c0_g1_i1.p1 TRINITY_DN110119_c0_g1~~TRINITY_DN110119_c0_g1_i1.p1  ORF type:complete len:933 (+),score=196.75 TRINITY_DN110119_c0_g1_i1:124-2922(+)
MVSLAAAAAATSASAASVGGTLFGYNRDNFLYDRKMRQETEYQIMDFRIKQAELWREDVRDIIGLTSVKMDTYLIVNAVQLGFTVMAFCEGRLAVGTPPWLVGAHTLSLAGAFMYLLMSVWFAMHASVTAKSYEVRLLTQLVRLPVPSWSQLEGARTYASTYEKLNSRQMFRVPFAMGTQEDVLGNESAAPANQPSSTGGGSNGAEKVESSDLWGLEGRGDGIYELDGSVRANPDALHHLQLIQNCMQYWQSYDGFARVSMSMGTNQLVTALSYYVIAYVLISNKAVIAAFLVVLLFMVIATALIRLDMSLTGLEFRAAVVLVFAGPCLTALAAQQWSLHTTRGYETVNFLSPLPYMFQASWLMLLLYISKVGEQEGGAMLPTGFRSVMYIDVFGWVRRKKAEEQTQQVLQGGSPGSSSVQGQGLGRGAAAPGQAAVSGNGPAVQSVQFQGSIPVASRPEGLGGAAQGTPAALITKEMFDPTTFVPRDKEDVQTKKDAIDQVQPYLRPGYVPWRIFCSATSLLVFLWWISGVFMLLQASGWNAIRVAPLLSGGEGSHEINGPEPVHDSHGAMFLLDHVAPAASAHHTAFIQIGGHNMQIMAGRPVETHWPHAAGTAPRSLACGMDGHGRIAFTAASRFGLFTAKMSKASKSQRGQTKQNLTVAFDYAPPCDELNGEALQDVSMVCGGQNGACTALVLHRQGQRLSMCGLSAIEAARQMGQPDAVMSVSDGWLGEGNAAGGTQQEEVASIALAGKCADAADSQCAYAETSRGRLVELKTGLSQSASSSQQHSDWFPTRTLLADISGTKTAAGGTLHMMGNQLIGVLAKGGTELRALDPKKGGAVTGVWPLPPQHRWTSMCSAAGNLYLMSEGTRTSQIWQFPLPSVLQPESQSKPTASLDDNLDLSADPVPKTGRAAMGRKSKHHQQHLEASA